MSELSNGLLLAYIGVMALVTYLIRLLPLVLFTQKINNVLCAPFYITCLMPFWGR